MFDNDFNTVELGTVIDTISGGTASRHHPEYYENGIHNWIKSKELLGSYIFESEEKITNNAILKSSAKLLPAYSVLVAMYGATVGAFGISVNDSTCNQAICALIQNENYPYSYIFRNIRLSKEKLKKMAVGSAQQNISQIMIKQLPVHADIDKIQAFNKIAERGMNKLFILQKELHSLVKLREVLLPKLMLENSDSSTAKLSFI